MIIIEYRSIPTSKRALEKVYECTLKSSECLTLLKDKNGNTRKGNNNHNPNDKEFDQVLDHISHDLEHRPKSLTNSKL